MLEMREMQGYDAFGSLLPGRNFSSGSYRFGFQGQEKDDEVYGATGTSYAFEYRMHGPREVRFWSIDPLAAKYPHNSPYAFSENRVIDAVELEGLEKVTINGQDKPATDPNSLTTVFDDDISKAPSDQYSQRVVAGLADVGAKLDPLAAQIERFQLNQTGVHSEHWTGGASHGRTDYVDYDYVATYYDQNDDFHIAQGTLSVPALTTEYAGIKDAPLIILTEVAILKISQLSGMAAHSQVGQGVKASEQLAPTTAQLSKHAKIQLGLADRSHITHGMIDATIAKGRRFWDPKNKSINYVLEGGFASGKNLTVGTSPASGLVTTIMPNSRIPKRFVPLP